MRHSDKPDTLPDDAIVITRTAADSGDPEWAVSSMIDVLNALYGVYVRSDEVNQSAVRHYLVDYYLAQVGNGGHSQFLSNVGGLERGRLIIDGVDQGIAEIGHAEATAAWTEFLATVRSVPKDIMQEFIEGYLDTDGFHPLDALESFDERYQQYGEELSKANGRLLLSRPELVVIDNDAVATYLTAREARVPDLEQRRQEAFDNAPSDYKAAVRYCTENGIEFERFTAGQAVEVAGQQAVEWFFLAGNRLFSLIELADGEVRFAEHDRTRS